MGTLPTYRSPGLRPAITDRLWMGTPSSGPAGCSRSILLAITEGSTADARYCAFRAKVIAQLP